LFFHCFVSIWLSLTVYALQNYYFYQKNKQKSLKMLGFNPKRRNFAIQKAKNKEI